MIDTDLSVVRQEIHVHEVVMPYGPEQEFLLTVDGIDTYSVTAENIPLEIMDDCILERYCKAEGSCVVIYLHYTNFAQYDHLKKILKKLERQA